METKFLDNQLEDDNFRLLQAYNRSYSEAKLWKSLQLILSSLLVVFSIYNINCNAKLTDIIAFSGFVITLGNFFINYEIYRKVQIGSLIHYQFDSVVLDIVPNHFIEYQFPDACTIKALSDKNKKMEKERWYSTEAVECPVYIQKYLLIRSNLEWDIPLRIWYKNILVFVLSVIIAGIIVYGWMYNIAIQKIFLEVAIPFLPLFLFCIDDIMKSSYTIKEKKEMQSYMKCIWNQFLDKQLTKDQIDDISKEVFDSLHYIRAESTLIFNFVYNHLKPNQDKQMDFSVRKAAKMFLEAYPSTS